MIKLSAAIIVFNEERNIGRCLESLLDIADEIIIVDSNSTDKTLEIAKKFNVKIYQQDFLGYAEQKNFANSLCTFNHIISLDADEVISENLKQEILSIKNNFAADAYELNRLTNYAGKWVHWTKRIATSATTDAEWHKEKLSRASGLRHKTNLENGSTFNACFCSQRRRHRNVQHTQKSLHLGPRRLSVRVHSQQCTCSGI